MISPTIKVKDLKTGDILFRKHSSSNDFSYAKMLYLLKLEVITNDPSYKGRTGCKFLALDSLRSDFMQYAYVLFTENDMITYEKL